jgi:hypothetical protein
MGEIKAVTDKIKKFRDERDWMQFHDDLPPNKWTQRRVGISISTGS